jgi:3-isopropylmalate/(R)-2-methylmalate dehydratase small subunit
MNIKGKTFKYGDNINTDYIIAGKYTKTLDYSSLADHVLEDLDPEFSKRVQTGDILSVGDNFGCGSSREQAPLAIKHSGVSAILAKSYARIFYRNSINIGLPALVLDTDQIQSGDILEILFKDNIVLNHSRNIQIPFDPMPEIMLDILNEGGLVNYLNKNRDFKVE